MVTSKSSNTNHPKLSRAINCCLFFILTSFNNMSQFVGHKIWSVWCTQLKSVAICDEMIHEYRITQTIKIFRCLYRRCLPLPIPNREVKPARADGTAVTRGRVGRCQILKEACRKLQAFLVYRLFLLEKVPWLYSRNSITKPISGDTGQHRLLISPPLLILQILNYIAQILNF